MLVAGLIMVVGLLGVAVITQRYGYRLGGTITVGVLAVYTLKNVVMLPVFLLSTLIAYIGLSVLKERTLIFGRSELVASIFIGSAIPLAILVALSGVVGDRLRAVVFIGSILPGLAAYNYHQLKPQYRLPDIATATGLYAGLLALGWLLVTPATAQTLGTLTPPVLFADTADIAVYKGAVTATATEPVIIQRTLLVVLLLAGMGLSELARSRFGVRLGIISLALLAVYALASAWLVALYLVTLLASFLFIELLHRRTLLYGRVLIGLGTAFAVVLVVPLAVYSPVVRGLSAFFVGILAGVNAYNRHVTPSAERPTRTALVVAVFLPLFALALAVGDPLSGALVTELTPVVGVVLVAGTLVAAAVAFSRHVERPSDEDVFRNSVLSGGDGT
ncbi:hypothetical protein AUR64_14875 [Haloprofundus marisrubri]|uniref:Capsule biosynthesis CapC n=1 Tax=Haloprofundus marisrubri TaxID=1514971 RepID=A0A0W1R6P0_9EURY|nr:poly-gamma-glutamate biosynthesis protein PgsC/CapC [Haloprofundus marisrubri]KTG09080.1 hypothetical protein AUR64_14875 [Haloprofundus marisrubri]